MGPTQRSPPASFDYSSNDDVQGDSKNTRKNTANFIVNKIAICPENLEKIGNTLKSVVATLQKLSKRSVPHELIQYGEPWFEGPLSEDCCRLTGLVEGGKKKTASQEEETQGKNQISSGECECTFLCVPKESYEYVSLENWLKDRESQVLLEPQIFHILSQLTTAVTFIEEIGLRKSDDKGFSLEDVHIVIENGAAASGCTQDVLPSLKVTNLDFEVALQSNFCLDKESSKTTSLLKPLAQLFLQLLQRTNKEGVSIDYPDEYKLIQEMLADTMNNDAFQVIISKLKNLGQKYTDQVVFNIGEPQRNFFGCDEDLTSLQKMTTSESNIILVHGSTGTGRSSLVEQLSKSLLSEGYSVFAFNAECGDSLTRSLHSCILSHSKLCSIPIRDYIGNPKSLNDIFQDFLTFIGERNFCLVLENANSPTEEILNLVQIFSQTLKSDVVRQKRHNLIITSTNLWQINTPSVSSQDFKVIRSQPKINQNDAIEFLQKVFINQEPEATEHLKTLQEMCDFTTPAALQLLATYVSIRSSSTIDFNSKTLLDMMRDFMEKHPQLVNSETEAHLRSTLMVYSLSLNYILESSNEQEKFLTTEIIKTLQYIDGSLGVTTDLLSHILQHFKFQNESIKIETEKIKSTISLLQKFGLIKLNDGVIRVSNWMQICLRESVQILFKDVSSNQELLSAMHQALLANESDSMKGGQLIPHATKMWLRLCKPKLELAKQFDQVPALIAKTADNLSVFEQVTTFLKQATDIFTTCYSSTSDFRVLQLKFLLAVKSLLPKQKMNEAFIILKMISEHSRTEPRDFLMLKLRSLIEVGQICVERQDYEKAISCFQQVQVFAVQKISTLELDSEPTVLKSRLMHGRAHIQQGNHTEGKKILVHIIPLLERYSGAEKDQVKKLLLQAKFALAAVLRKSGDLVNALMMQTKVMEEREKIHGGRKHHPDIWECQQEMAMLFSSYDNHEKALALLKELLEEQEQVLGAPSNRQSLTTMNSIAEIESRLGNFDDALELYEAIDLIEQQVLAENDEMRINSQLNQADVLMALGQYKEAIDIFDLIYALLQSSSEERKSLSGHQLICDSIMSKREKAERSMEILGNYWLSLTPENVDDPSELAALAKKHEVATELCENQDNHGALRFLREVLEDCGHLEESNRFLINVKADLARVLGLVGKFNESFSVYKEILPLMDAAFGETDELTMLCKDTMGQVFLFSGNQFLKRQMSNLKWFLF